MNYKIDDIEGIGSAYGKRLENTGIKDTETLLTFCGSKSGRQKIAEKTEIPENLILTWVNHADLMRINGVGAQFAELLEAAGVDTVKELAQRNADNLYAKMNEVNDNLGLSGRTPSLENIQEMIAQSKSLEPKVSH